MTTVLNPKALIFGLALVPHGTFGTVLPWLGLFLLMVVSAGCVWLSAGAAMIYRKRAEFPPLLSRVAAGAMLLFSASLAGSSLGLL